MEPPAEHAPPPSAPPVRRSIWIPSVFGAVFAFALLSSAFLLPLSFDAIFLHLKIGELIVGQQSIPATNLFSFTAPGHFWIAQDWLSEVVFFLVHEWLGTAGLIALGAILNAVACAVVYRITVRNSGSPFLSVLVTLLAFLMMVADHALSPALFGNVFFALALSILEAPEKGGRLRPVLVFLLFFLWANCHGSFLLGLAMIVLYLASATFTYLWAEPASGPSARGFLRDFGVALVATVCTPHHVFGLIFPFMYIRQALDPQLSFLASMSDLRAPTFYSPLGRMISFYLLFSGFAVLGSGKAPRPVYVGLIFAFAAFAFASVRHIALLGIAATPMLAIHIPETLQRTWQLLPRTGPLADLLVRLHGQLVEWDRQSRKVLLVLVSLGLLGLLLGTDPRTVNRFVHLAHSARHAARLDRAYPRGLIGYLQQLGPNVRLFHHVNWGGALIYAFYPRLQVFIDPRADCYPLEVFYDYLAMHRVDGDWKQVLDRFRINTIAYPQDSELARALRLEPDWRQGYADGQAVVYLKRSVWDIPSNSEEKTSALPSLKFF